MDNPAMEIWASLAMFKLNSLNLIFPPLFKACQKYINIELFISTITYYNDTYNQVYDNPSFAK